MVVIWKQSFANICVDLSTAKKDLKITDLSDSANGVPEKEKMPYSVVCQNVHSPNSFI